MEVAPYLYHWFVRPKWMTRKYIHNHIKGNFDLKNKKVFDFGAGTGANCSICCPDSYHGVDPDLRRIQFASRLYPGYRFSVLQDGTLPAEDQSYDFVMILAVLHHISSEEIARYMAEFRRILAPDGRVIVMEPCLWEQTPFSNWFMQTFDKGDYIRSERDYLELFEGEGFSCQVLNRFKKGFFYNELFFSASPVQEKRYH
jgi:SAM-dependent methyltransferase